MVLADGSNGGLAANYNISASDFQIQKRPLAVQVQRQYDGTATFSSSDSVFFEYQTMSSPPSNAVGRTGVLLETLSLSGTGTTSGSATNAGTYEYETFYCPRVPAGAFFGLHIICFCFSFGFCKFTCLGFAPLNPRSCKGISTCNYGG